MDVIRNPRCSTLIGLAVVLLGLVTACAGPPGSPGRSTSQSSALVVEEPGLHTITPTYNELEIDTSAGNGGPTLPWSLVRVDRDLNRIYLTASKSGCVTPTKVRLEETATSITLAVVGVGGGTGPCTMQAVTMLGYVTTKSSLGDRDVRGNTP